MNQQKHQKANCYLTWQTAAKAAQKMGINSPAEYKKRYAENLRLPSFPDVFYKNFPGYDVFLGKTYKTWREASYYVGESGITTMEDYEKLCQKNRLLPNRPDLAYRDYPGDERFLSEYKDSYKRAKFFVKKQLGIKTSSSRHAPRPKSPEKYYKKPKPFLG